MSSSKTVTLGIILIGAGALGASRLTLLRVPHPPSTSVSTPQPASGAPRTGAPAANRLAGSVDRSPWSAGSSSVDRVRDGARPPAGTGRIAGTADARPAGEKPTAVVYVAGEVAHPGVYVLPDGSRAEAALRAAGGATKQADLVAVNLAARIADGEEILVPRQGDAATRTARGSRSRTVRSPRGATLRRASAQAGSRGRGRKPLPDHPIDLNSADARDLATLPGIGAGLAARIVAFRELNGRFASADELLDVAGMTDRRLTAIEPYVTVR